VVLVLGGLAGFDGVVSRVVWSRGDFVDVYPAYIDQVVKNWE
jgi:hypothetical protein